MPIVRNPRIKHMKELAAAVGAKIRVEYDEAGTAEYVLVDGKGENVCREYDTFDMLDSIQAYYGGHENYNDARAQFNYMVGEDD